ncbi:MAG: hypothetical protein HON23_01515 [Rickettsiales bacterium]|jgi:F-type H+-transporting ATPase subunit b|nr:hypothetical protein [Rickettsiales bacterium]
MPQLEFLTYPFASQLFWLFFSFGLLYLFATKLIIPRISSIKEDRSNTIGAAVAAANRLKDEALKANSESSNYLKESKAKADKLIGQALARLKEQESVALNQAKQSLDGEIADLSLQLAKYKESMQTEFSNIVVDLTKHVLEKSYGISTSDEEILNYIGTK